MVGDVRQPCPRREVLTAEQAWLAGATLRVQTQIGSSHACYSSRHKKGRLVLRVHCEREELESITVYYGSLAPTQPRNSFFILRSSSMIADSVVQFVALL